MTFEEWFTAHYVKRGFVSSKDELREAWEAATKAEREACAEVCDIVREQKIPGTSSEHAYGRDMAATVCARTIRDRGLFAL